MIPYYISQARGDYPGPKEIYSNYGLSTSSVDYLLIHGASLDARVWNGVLQRNSDKSMVAISLANHEDGVKYADPFIAAQDLVNYLKTHKVNKAIVGHSTASLWIAEAYSICQDCFNGVKIILLSPSFGENIMKDDLTTLNKLNKISFLLPDPMLHHGDLSSCQGGEDGTYNECKKVYRYGRLFLFDSIKYYNNVVKYSLAHDTTAHLDYFLKDDKKNIIIYISDSDKVLDPQTTIKMVQDYNLKYKVVNNISHVMLVDQDKIWLGDFDSK